MTRRLAPARGLAEVQLGRQRSPKHAEGPHMTPYLRAANVKDGELDLSDVKQMNFDPSEQEIFRLQPGDVLISEGAGSLVAVGTSAVYEGDPPEVCFQNTLLRLRPREDVDPGFVAWWARAMYTSGEFARFATGASIYHLGAERVRAMRAWIPAFEEQQRISAFLDDENKRLDRLVATKARMVAVTAEWANAAIETAVLGLNLESDPATSDYYETCPKGWSGTLLRHLECKVQTGPFGSQLHQEDYVEGGVPVVNPANLRGGEIVAIESMTVGEEKLEELSRHQLLPGDIVFGRRGEMGRAGLVTEVEEGWLCGTGSLRLRIRDDRLDPRFLKLVLETSAMRRYFSLNSVGSTMENLNSDIVLGMPLVLPPMDTQAEIVESSRGIRRVHDELVSALEDQIGLLHEHRRSLINAAVTGEMKVP